MRLERPVVAVLAFVLALSLVHAIVGFWTPIQADDWNAWIWAGRHNHESGAAWLGAWLISHFTFSDAMAYVLARCRTFHVLVTPAVVVALVVGLFTVAMRRLPRASWEDLLGLAVVSALLWIGQPSAAVTLFRTQNVALFVYGCAVAAWFVVPVRCGWRVPRAAWPVIAIAGYCTGTSTRAIATATLVYMILALRRRRERWMWIALGGLVVGLVAGYFNPPWLELGRVLRRGFEQNLTGPGLIKFFVEEGGEVISLVAAFVLADIGLGLLGRPRAPAEGRPDPADTLGWFIAWFATAVWCLFGPSYEEAMLLPTSALLVIGAVPYLLWLARSRVLRYLLVAIVVAIHAIAWSIALVRYHKLGAEFAARMQILETTPPGKIAVIPTYSQVPSDFWFDGEDLGIARVRALVAIDAFRLRDIDLDPPFRHLDLNPHIEFSLDTDGLSDTDLRAAHAPTIWAGDVVAARKQFELFLKRVRALGKRPSARLVVTNLELGERGARPLLAAWADAKGTMIPRTVRSPLDPNGEYTVRIYQPDAGRFHEGWVIQDGKAHPVPYRNGALRVQPMQKELDAMIACNAERCLLADAFVPRF